ncbi:E3 SUMO-protein ligase ZBED1-like [Eupeodes corollae]|uniref:E3 SUMO-protein ligase ZBED1-like n=1 Tax=Eupeodes corollae TaxID=290404 RepID=UPI00248FD55D|nr:E3 SUMO-protein ligase ZBED1-like [Eupeodes corollae]
MPGPRQKSIVWEVFKKSEGGTVVCKKCSCSYKYSGNTSTMMGHIKKKHPGEFLDITDGEVNTDIDSIQRTNAQPSTNQQVRNVAIAQPSNSEETPAINKRLRQSRLIVPSKLCQKSADNALVDLIVLDFQPLQIVENEGFRRYSKVLNSEYNIPSRKKIAEMLQESYSIESRCLMQKLQEIEYIALTSDIWTSDSNKCFISITAHYVEQAKMKTSVISTSELEENHTAENIATKMRKILDEWQIGAKVVSIVTDNAASMKKAVSEILNKRNHYCVAHTLNLAVKDCIDKPILEEQPSNDRLSIPQILSKCRGIVSHFNHSAKSSYALHDMQIQMNTDTLKLKQDVRTRWNSTFYMLERLLKVKVSLSATLPLLEASPSNLDFNEWILIEEIIKLLRPFEKITVILSGESYPSLSCIIPLVVGLQETLANKNLSTESAKLLQRNLLTVIEKRLGIYEVNRTAAKSTFLDPRFKKKGFGTESHANNAQMWVIEELRDYLINSSASSIQCQPSTSNAVTAETNDEDDEIWGVLDKKISETQTTITPFSSAAGMVKQYIDLEYLGRNKNPLEFWEEKRSLFPSLYKLAHKYLCIPATSVPSERLFSKAGLLCNERRNRLAPKKVDQILFLNSAKKSKLT